MSQQKKSIRRSLAWATLALMGIGTSPVLAQPEVKLPPQDNSEEIPAPAAQPADTSFWIGVMCHAVEDALRAHITLPEGQGLSVADVVPGGPAAAAGIARHDILLTAGGTALTSPADLITAVNASGEQPVEVELLRGGQPMTIEVAPVARPQQPVRPVLIGPGEQGELQDWMEDLQRQIRERREGNQQRRGEKKQRRPLRLRFLQPDPVTGEGLRIPLPEGMSVSISREDGKPMRVRIRQGEEEFELGAGDLLNGDMEQLPENFRPHVQGLLERMMNSSDGKLPFGRGGRGQAASEESNAETEALIPDISIPGLEEDSADSGTTEEILGPAVDLRDAESAIPSGTTTSDDAAAPAAPPEVEDGRLPPASAADAQLEEVGAAIRALQEQLREIRQERRERRAKKAAERKEKQDSANDKDAEKEQDSDRDSDDGSGTI